MKLVSVFLLVYSLAICGLAQTPDAPLPNNVYAFGPSFNSSGSPRVAGTALYARKLTDSGTYEFNVVDILPNNDRPFTVTTNLGVGVAQKLFSIGKFPVFVPASLNLSLNGSNTGWGYSTGALVPVRIKNEWHLDFTGRVVKSSVSNGTGYQPIVGILLGWHR